jgi:translation initiation factor IF-3
MLTHRELLVIDKDGANKGVMAAPEGYALAKSQGLDLVLLNPNATPPVARVMSLAAELRSRRKAAASSKSAQGARKLKEIQFTSRTGEHDLGIKAGKVVAFLEAGNPVKVTVWYSEGLLNRDESARRTMLEAVLRRVEKAGVGFCDAATITAFGKNLFATVVPVATPRGAERWEPIYKRLSSPIRTEPQEAPSAVAADVAHAIAAPAAADAPASSAKSPLKLPPAKSLLRTFSEELPKPKAGRKDVEDEEEEADSGIAEGAAPVTRGRRRSRTREPKIV